MPKSPLVRDGQQTDEVHREEINYRAQFDELNRRLPFEYAIILTTLPRGSTQITQPRDLNDAFVKGYREFQGHDRTAWEAIAAQKTLRAMDCWPNGKFESSAYLTGFLRPMRLQFVLAAPLMAPVLDGYRGAIELFRKPEDGPFDSRNITTLTEFGKELDETIARDRASRRGVTHHDRPLTHSSESRLFVFDADLHPRVSGREFESLDPTLQKNILELSRQRLTQTNNDEDATDRVSLPDSRGDLWHFRMVLHNAYPALGEGRFIFFCIQPECADLALLRPSDFAADQELARLIPAVNFMQQEFSRGPTLHEIARTVHLSPFHFHRRFTELLGITPKHFLLDCQIEKAKDALVARQKELSAIAKECGFAHQSHFTSRFKQATGLTPTRWRRLALELAQV